jgi:carbamoylphosphate synthase large subunit
MPQAETLKQICENLLHRNLTKKEIAKLEWIEGWEEDTKKVMRKLMRDLYISGFDARRVTK